jgi:hypothetical protein
MSAAKFASITGALLARKGEAGPSADGRAGAGRWLAQPDAATAVTLPPSAPKPKAPAPQASFVPDAAASVKIALRLSEAQHFRMRVAAAQMQVTRQALLSAALDHYLATVCAAETPGCHCLTSGQGCGCGSR